ncbi:replication protein [Moraxella bovis]|uniref:replication protein n=1 Tax=Moraxella bovis TaxID=476 RepID=UPI0022267CF2|nr:replication protein [Moraxella bovis]UZA09706.1 replication protein [Moraxella bovis]UZA10106.1 replication protein [Moraxella bovis]UZA34150.1 replication protein [Moraxella bovis]UZA34553.1 replication protein [Moraxella bovis]
MSKFIANSFQLPNAFVDEMLCKLSGNACKIYLLIVRKTRGWHKEADRISYSQIQKYTGINSRTTISKALDELLDLGLIIMQNGNEKSSNEYRLNDGFASPKNGLDKNCTSPKNEPASPKNEPASPKNGLQPSPKNGHTEIHIFKNTRIKNKSVSTHEHTHENLENSQTAKPNKSTGKSPSAKKFITADELVSLGVDEQVANDYLATRKTKLTQTALSGIAKQATLAGVSLAKAIEFACEMGWQSFKADWYQNAQTKFGNPQPTNRMDELRHMANTNPTNVFVDDLPSDFQNYIGVNS